MPRIELIGAPWCGACKVIRKKLTSLDLRHHVTMIPPGPAGWEYVEAVTGKKAVPAVMVDGKLTELNEFVRYISSLNLPERALTQDELDEIED